MLKTNTLTNALRQFEATEANFLKLERLWEKCKNMIPDSICFGDDPGLLGLLNFKKTYNQCQNGHYRYKIFFENLCKFRKHSLHFKTVIIFQKFFSTET